MLLAESVQISGGALLLILAVFLAVIAASVAVVVLGFVWARRAAAGSRSAMVGFVAVVGAEVVSAVGAVVAGEGDPTFGIITLALAAAQVGVHLRWRARRAAPVDEPRPPTP